MRDLIPRRREVRTMMDRWFGDLFDDIWRQNELVVSAPLDTLGQGRKYSYPRINIQEKTDIYEIEAAVPGLTKDDVRVDYADGILTISASSQNERKSDENGYVIRELHKSSFSRSLRADPEVCDVENIEASVEDGILSVKIPKLEVDKPPPKRIIEVK